MAATQLPRVVLASNFALLACLVLNAALPAHTARVLVKGCIKQGTFNPRTNYFSSAFKRQPFAARFSVRYYNYYKVVKDNVAGTSYVLYQCGAPKPNVGAASLYVQVPLTAYAVSSDVTANYLQLLGVQPQLKAAPPGSMVDPCMQKVILNLPASSSSLPVFSAFYNPKDYMGSNISFSATFESSPLRRAEWIKYLSLFFNKEDRANEVYVAISRSYACNTRKAAAVKSSKPYVVWLSYYGGNWTLSAAAYKQQYVMAAGGRNPRVLRSGNDVIYDTSTHAGVAALHKLLASVAVVIDESYLSAGPPGYSLAAFEANANLTKKQASKLPFVRSGNLWSVYGTYTATQYPATAWFEGAVSQPQIVLQELVSIVRPAVYPRGITHTFLYNVPSGAARPITIASCRSRNIYAAVAPSRAGC